MPSSVKRKAEMKKLLRYWWVLVIGLVVLSPVAVMSTVPRGDGWVSRLSWLSPKHFRVGTSSSMLEWIDGSCVGSPEEAMTGEHIYFGVFEIHSYKPWFDMKTLQTK